MAGGYQRIRSGMFRTEYRDLGYIFLLFYLRDRFEFVTDGFFFLL